MKIARIFQAKPPATQSAPGRDVWVLEYAPSAQKRIDPLMGWTGSSDMARQVRLEFESKEAALAYARKQGVVAQVETPQARKLNVRPLGYGGNFAHNRRAPWSH